MIYQGRIISAEHFTRAIQAVTVYFPGQNFFDCVSIRKTMRGLIARFVIALMVSGAATPLVLSSAADPIPACCRRDGKHHCHMAQMLRDVSQDGLPQLQAPASICPYHHLSGPSSVAFGVAPIIEIGGRPLSAKASPTIASIPVTSPLFQFVSLRGPPQPLS